MEVLEPQLKLITKYSIYSKDRKFLERIFDIEDEYKSKVLDNLDLDFLNDLNKFYLFKEISKNNINYNFIVNNFLKKDKVSNNLKIFFEGYLLSLQEEFIPTTNNSNDYKTFLMKELIQPDIFSLDRIGSAFSYLKIKNKEQIDYILKKEILYLFRYYKEFNELPNSEQDKVIKTLTRMKNKSLDELSSNKEAYLEYSYYSFFLFLNLYFQHINGIDREKELNELLKENIRTLNNLSDKSLFNFEIVSPINFFYGIKVSVTDMPSDFQSYFEIVIDSLLSYDNNEKENPFSDFDYKEELNSFAKKIKARIFRLDKELIEIVDKTDFEKIKKGLKKTYFYLDKIYAINNSDYDNIDSILNKPFEKLETEEIILVDNFFRKILLEKKNSNLDNRSDFIVLLKKYLDYLNKFIINDDNLKEMFYKHTIIENKETKKLIDKIFDKKDEIIKKESEIKNIFYNQKVSKNINEILDIIGIQPPSSYESRMIIKAINYILFVKEIKNPFIFKMYIENDFFTIHQKIPNYERFCDFFVNPFIEEEDLSNKKNTFSINNFISNLFFSNYIDSDKLFVLAPNSLKTTHPSNTSFFIFTKSSYNFLKQKILYEYSKEMQYPIEKLTTKKDEPLIAYFKFIDAFIEGKLEDADKAFKEVEKYTKDYMKMVGENFETFYLFKNFVLDKISFYNSTEDKKITIRNAKFFRTKTKKLVKRYKDSLFWNFLADTVFSKMSSSIVENKVLREISDILEPYKIYNMNFNFIKEHFSYFNSLSKTIKLTQFVRKETFLDKYKNEKGEEFIKNYLFLLKSQLIPITYTELFYFYKKNLKSFEKDTNSNLFVLNLLLSNFKPVIIEIQNQDIIKDLEKEETTPRTLNSFFTHFNNKFYAIGIKDIKNELITEFEKKPERSTEFFTRHPFTIKYKETYLGKLFKSVNSQLSFYIKDINRFEKIVHNKIKNKDYEFKTFIDFFESSLFEEDSKVYKKEMIKPFSFFLSLTNLKVSKDILVKVALNSEKFFKNDYIALVERIAYSPTDYEKSLDLSKEEISQGNFPILIGPLEYKNTITEALKESAAVFAINFKNQINFVKSLIKTKNKEKDFERNL